MMMWFNEVKFFLEENKVAVNEQIIGEYYVLELVEYKFQIYCMSVGVGQTLEVFKSSNVLESVNRKIFLWEDVWKTKKAICKSRILANCGISNRIPARLTKVRRIDKPTLDNFLIDNHLQVVTNAKLKYGLYLPKQYFRVLPENFKPSSDEILVAVASFSNAKTILRDEQEYRSYELIRFANLLNFTVVGGLDKLLKAFIAENKPDDIMTYADRDWSDGRSYEKVGFERIGITPPQEFFLNTELLQRYYPNKLPEHSKAMMKQVFNAGNIKFLMKLK
jgi:hypothetical protein